MQSYVDSDSLFTKNLFIEAARLGNERQIISTKTLQRLERRIDSDRYAFNDSIALTNLLPEEPAGYLRGALILIKRNEDDLDALELLINASKVAGPKPPPDSKEYHDWYKISEIISHYIDGLKLKTGYNRRRDPCKVFPLEVLNLIFSQLNMKSWVALQIVSKSWRDYLINDPYLWASSIDFNWFEKRKCNQVTLKYCLDLAFVKSCNPLEFNQVPNMQYLGIGPFSTSSSEIDCLSMLCKDRFIYQGKTIDKISIEFRKLPKGQDLSEAHPIYNLVSTKYLLLSTIYPRNLSNIYLDSILLSQTRLKEFCLSCRNVLSKYDGLEIYPPLNSIKYPLLQVLDLNATDISEISYLVFFNSPNLRILKLSLSTNFDIEWFCKAKLPLLESLEISFSKDHSRNGHSGRVSFGGLFHPLHIPPEYTPEWPRSLNFLTLSRIEWSFMQSVSGSLEWLQILNLSYSRIDINEFFYRFKCGNRLKVLVLDGITLGDQFIWEKCNNVKRLSLFKVNGLNEENVDGIIRACNRLEEVDLGKTGISEEQVLKVSEVVNKIGCKSITIKPEVLEVISKRAIIVKESLDIK